MEIKLPVQQEVTAKECYDAGYDAGFNKPTEHNCGIKFFQSPDNKFEWEKGYQAGKFDKLKKKYNT
jgi:hypothetical protein